VDRRFRSLPIGSRATFVDFSIPRVECQACRVAVHRYSNGEIAASDLA
jgi:hypothetical protein